MSQKRHDERITAPLQAAQRTKRAYEINGQWYFELRDGGQKGPYDNQLAMQADLNEFVSLLKKMDQQN